jgi:hypothetical protein
MTARVGVAGHAGARPLVALTTSADNPGLVAQRTERSGGPGPRLRARRPAGEPALWKPATSRRATAVRRPPVARQSGRDKPSRHLWQSATLKVWLDAPPRPTPAPGETGGVRAHRRRSPSCRAAGVGVGPWRLERITGGAEALAKASLASIADAAIALPLCPAEPAAVLDVLRGVAKWNGRAPSRRPDR